MSSTSFSADLLLAAYWKDERVAEFKEFEQPGLKWFVLSERDAESRLWRPSKMSSVAVEISVDIYGVVLVSLSYMASLQLDVLT